MTLKQLAKQNNMCCATCGCGFKNHRYEDDPKPQLTCGHPDIYGSPVSPNEICIRYQSEEFDYDIE